jgi:hypothetical protein
MSTQPSQPIGRAEPAIAVGSWHDGVADHFLPFSEVEARRATNAWRRIFDATGLERGSAALVVALVEETHQLIPLEAALDEAGVLILNADASLYEAQRIEAFIRNFDPACIFGLTAATLEGLTERGHDVAQLLAGRSVWVRDCAHALLKGLPGLRLLRWTALGPAVLMGCGRGDGLHIDRFEWSVAIDGGRARLAHRLGAAAPAPVTVAAPGARLLDSLCPCGNGDPLIALA